MADRFPVKPQVAALPDGRIAVFLGADYKYMDTAAARTLRDQISMALGDALPGQQAAGQGGQSHVN